MAQHNRRYGAHRAGLCQDSGSSGHIEEILSSCISCKSIRFRAFMNKVEILAVIHARGGSKRIPLKNLALLQGKPLLAYPILTARASRRITRTVVTTDHDGIMEEAKKWGAE